MSRSLRIEYATALYHMISRGNARQPSEPNSDKKQDLIPGM